ncbi:TIGR01906 family membrane protein [Alkalibacterium olivapovliticus]|uniref:Integral membrane protein (TIGR01906 family) n=1 Tax=Alkalibacterium olivapovliticus TaxID=99907 RepID=A0A2T0W8D9_9LACT|nr:TIGR01906 family membrane protein [Alkalibacterium olivapovliticus]PRY82804.1 integral membrane protein (TIGR01906 family) [Alkalibacterium olivapovliticus]
MILLKKIAGFISLLLLIITASIAIVILFTPLYHFSAWYHDIPERLNMSYDTLIDNYYVLLRYLHFPWIQELNLPDFPSSESGLFHFWEVKILFYINYGVLVISALASYVYIRYVKQNRLFWTLQKPFFAASLVPPILLMLLAINFDRMFVIFHELFFNNDAWLFNPATDPIILALPQEFFMYCFILFFILIEASFIFGYRYSKKNAFK